MHYLRNAIIACAVLACSGIAQMSFADEPVVVYCIQGTNPQILVPCPQAQSLPPVVNSRQSTPLGVTITATATGTTGAITATLGGTASVTTYICGFVATSGGTTTPTTGTLTVNNLAGAANGTTMNFAYVTGSATSQGVLGAAFPACIPALGPSQPITITMPASGSGTLVEAISAWGYTGP